MSNQNFRPIVDVMTAEAGSGVEFDVLRGIAFRAVPQMIVTELSTMDLNGTEEASVSTLEYKRLQDFPVGGRLQICEKKVGGKKSIKKFHTFWESNQLQDVAAYLKIDAAAKIVNTLSREFALEHNMLALEMLSDQSVCPGTQRSRSPEPGFSYAEWNARTYHEIDQILMRIFERVHGHASHLFLGPDAFAIISPRLSSVSDSINSKRFPGLTQIPMCFSSSPDMNIYMVSFWGGNKGSRVLAVRRGSEDTREAPLGWAPGILGVMDRKLPGQPEIDSFTLGFSEWLQVVQPQLAQSLDYIG